MVTREEERVAERGSVEAVARPGGIADGRHAISALGVDRPRYIHAMARKWGICQTNVSRKSDQPPGCVEADQPRGAVAAEMSAWSQRRSSR